MSGLHESHVDSDEEDLAESIGSFTLRYVHVHLFGLLVGWFACLSVTISVITAPNVVKSFISMFLSEHLCPPEAGSSILFIRPRRFTHTYIIYDV